MSRLHLLTALSVLVGLPLALSGCLGEVQAVYVPQSAIPSGWEQSITNRTEEAAKGTVEVKINQYGRSGDLVGDVYLVGVTDVPAVDEHAEIEKKLQAFADKEGVGMTKTRSFSLTLDNGEEVQVTEYDIEKQVHAASVKGKAWFLSWDAGDFAAGGIGWATTERPGLLGNESDESAWEEAQSMMRAAQW